MPGSLDDSEGLSSSKVSLGHRLLLALPRIRRSNEKPPLRERLQSAVLKPTDPEAPVSKSTSSKSTSAKSSSKSRSIEDIEHDVRTADDKERLIGLIAAPFAALISILVIGELVSNDPAAKLKNGQPNKLHVNPAIYHDLLLVLLALSILMVAAAWFRKRMFLAIVTALFGLTTFNLHYWGFGVPFVMVGAWLFVRAYRFNKELREAGGGTNSGSQRPGKAKGDGASSARPEPSKRYTQPRPTPKRGSAPKSERDKRAG